MVQYLIGAFFEMFFHWPIRIRVIRYRLCHNAAAYQSHRKKKLLLPVRCSTRRTSAKLQKMLTSLSREKVSVVRKREVVLCSNCGKVMDLAGVTRLDEGGGLVYDEGDDDDYASW